MLRIHGGSCGRWTGTILKGICLVTAVFALAPVSKAQTATPVPPAGAKPHAAHKSHAKGQSAPEPPPQPETPPQPEAPKWPVNDPPSQPAVTWDSQGLHIQAANASLSKILSEVSTRTGAKIEGMSADERVFGDYGPGQAREVLAQLLHGSGYNFLMLGDQGQGTPLEVVLSPHKANSAGPNPGVNRPTPDQSGDEDVVPDQPEEEPQPIQPPPPPPEQNGPQEPLTPQQRMQMMQQQRLQQLQQMQQQQQNQQQPQQQPQ